MTAISIEDQLGKTYLKTKDFVLVGIPCSVLSLIILLTMSYGLMRLILP